jgi:hypothetical protein
MCHVKKYQFLSLSLNKYFLFVLLKKNSAWNGCDIEGLYASVISMFYNSLMLFFYYCENFLLKKVKLSEIKQTFFFIKKNLK